MATLIPSLSSVARKMTGGERRFAQQLESHLEDDYLCWYDVPVGPSHAHPDFMVLHPRRGLLVLEVKDWKLDTISAMDRVSATLKTYKGLKAVINPLEQARQYAHHVSDLLEADPALVWPEAAPMQGRLVFPWGYGVVLTNITRKALENPTHAADLRNVLLPERLICQDEMLEAVDREGFQKRLWGMFSVAFRCALSMPQIDRIRWHLFPEIRVGSVQGAPDVAPAEQPSLIGEIPDIVRVMDLQQEQLARGLGEGHRIIHGVAGSGKTMILGYRAQYLARVLPKPILVLCYNVALSAHLAHVVAKKALSQKVNVRTFHAWCNDQLKLYHVPGPAAEPPRHWDELVNCVIRAVDRGQIPRAQYGAVLIDEGHDFEPDWLKLVAQMVDPESNSLLLLYDDAQSLYSGEKRKGFSFSRGGIQARGRTTILRLNYRNTAEVLEVAYEFAREVLTPKEAEEDGVPLLSPQSAGRHGPAPEMIRLSNWREEGDYVAERLQGFRKEGMPWNHMAILYRARFMGKDIAQGLERKEIPVEWLDRDKGDRRYRPGEESVKVMTMHGSKGLEFPVVVVPYAGYAPQTEAGTDEAARRREEARLLYVAMTRAMDRLVLTHHTETVFSARLRQAVQRVA